MSNRSSGRTKAKASAAAADTAAAVAALSAPAAAPSAASLSSRLVDLTAESSSSSSAAEDSPDVVMLSPPAKKAGAGSSTTSTSTAAATPAGAPKVLHPFFTSLTKKKPPTPAAAPATVIEPVAMASLEDERKEAPNATSAASADSPPAAAGAAAASAASASPSIVPASPSLVAKSELDSLYASKPKAEFFMTGRERVAVRVERKTKEFHAKIEAERAEDKAVIAIMMESGKKINPFLLPKPAQAAAAGSATKERSASSGAGLQLSSFSPVSFSLPDSTPFPSLCSHMPPPPALEPRADSTLWSGLHLSPQQSAPAKRQPRVISAPKHLTGLAVNEISALATLAASASAASSAASASAALPASVPLWARSPAFAPVDYLSSLPYRSSDVSNYLGQPRAQAFLKDLAGKLAAHMGGDAALAAEHWSFENVQKLVRRLFIRRVHCYRAAQRDEQQAAIIRKHKAERAAEEAAMEAGEDEAPAASLRTSAASSRSARAVQRGNKSETVEAVAHGDEQISHTFQPRPDSLWSEQYRAFKSDEMFGGNVHQRAQVRDWLKSWSIRQENEEQQKNGTEAASSAVAVAAPAPAPEAPLGRAARKKSRYVFHSDDEDFEDAWDTVYNPRSASPVRSAPAAAPVELSNTLLLIGPPCGKTSLIYACCHESGTGIIEIGSNSRRAQRDVLAQCEEATQSHRLALTTVAAGSGLNMAASAAKPTTSAFGMSPVKVKKAEPKSSKKKQKAEAAAATAAVPKAKASFNFFDVAARKNAATAAAAAPAAKAKGKKRAAAASSDDDSAYDDDGDDDDFLSPPKKKANTKDKSSAAAAAAAPAPISALPVKTASTTSKKSLFAQKTKSTLVAIKGMPDEISDDDESSGGSGQKKKQASAAAASSGGKLVQAADFFANPSAFASKEKPKVLSSTVITPGSATVSSAADASSGPAADPLAPVSQTSSQTALLFEEIDTVFPQVDRKFLSAVRTLVSNAKRPILLTCNRVTKEMRDEKLVLNEGDAPPAGMPIIECIRFEQPSAKDLLPYLYLIAAVEIGFHTAETQSRLPSLGELEQLLLFHQCDVRKTLLAMQLYLTSTPLTLLLGSENLLLASVNPTAAATALKKRTAQLRLFAPERTSQQDLILASQGLLDHKEEVLSLFDTQVDEQATRAIAAPPAKLASKDAILSATAAATALTMAQSEALYTAHNSEVQLLHLNYLSSLLLGAPVSAARAGDSMSDDSATATSPNSWWRLLPVRLSVLPLTAEEMHPLHLVQLTPEMLAVSPLLSEEQPSISADPPQSASAAEPALATDDTDMAPSVIDVDASLPPIIEATASLEASEEAEMTDAPSASPATAAAIAPGSSAATAADAIEVSDNDSDNDEAELGPRRHSGKKRIATVEEDESASPPVVKIDEDEGDESAAILAEQEKREVTAKKLLQATNKLRQEQRTSLREQLIVNEEARRAHLRAANRSHRVHNRALDRSVALLQEMAEMAECISAVDVFTVPVDNTYRSRLFMRSHSRFHPAIHPFVTSSSRDFLPLYLEDDIASSGWLSLEQSWQDEVEEEAERGDRDFKAEAAAKQATLTTLVSTTDKKAGAIQVVHDDYPIVTLEASRDMAASLEAHACARMRRATRAAQQTEIPEAHLQQLQSLTAATVPSVPFPPDVAAAAATSSSEPIVIEDDSNQVDLTLSPSPLPDASAVAPAAAPATPAAASASSPRPLFLPSLDAPTPPLSIQVYRSPSASTPEHRREMSQLMHYIWNHLQWSQHAPTSTAFLCDVFPYLRSLVFSALDSAGSHAAEQAAADAELAASLSSARASRRSTRSARNEPKLSRKWQLVADAMLKASAVEAVRHLQACPWQNKQNRPLQTQQIWERTSPALNPASAAN